MPINTALVPVFTEEARHTDTVLLYQSLTGAVAGPTLRVAASGLTGTVVGPVLVLSGAEAALAPAREVGMVFTVDSLAGATEQLLAHGAELVRELPPMPHGRARRLRHPDGLVVEYLELSRAPQGRPLP
ncbi:VOC family protein [Kitasatospora sp. NPDC094015]|uniref:VOC family protein n=1 Tax=Kitasatospora sp. NPDC094015 TaxID=3155205 RepID=UPI00332D575F